MSTAQTTSGPAAWIEDFGRSWNAFWFRPSDAALCSVLRIGLGFVALLHFAAYSSDLTRWFAADGLLPLETVDALLGGSGTYHPTLQKWAATPFSLWVLHIGGLVAALLLTCGLFSRLSALATALAAISLANRAPIISGPAEPVLVFMLLYLVVAPAGAYFSLDSLLARSMDTTAASILGGTREPTFFATLSLRLMQVHLAAFYLIMGLAKTYGDAWWDGAAAWNLLAQTHSRPLDLSSLRGNEFLLNAWTHFIAWTQLLFPLLVCSRLTRPIAISAAMVMWVVLLPLTGLTSFCLAMMVATLCYLPPTLIPQSWTLANKE